MSRNGVRYITREQADRLRARVAKDHDFYWRLQSKLSGILMKDVTTRETMQRASRAEHALSMLGWALAEAGCGRRAIERPWDEMREAMGDSRDADRWLGEGI